MTRAMRGRLRFRRSATRGRRGSRRRGPWVYAGVIASTGHTMTILPGKTACFRCYIGDAPPAGSVETCETAGVIAPAVHVVAGLAAGEALKVLAGKPDEVAKGLLVLDVW